MFSVRSARALLPSLESGPLPVHAACAATPYQIRYTYYESKVEPYQVGSSLSGELGTSAFNQPLSLDTSSVTDMHGMFAVSSACALPPAISRAHPPCKAPPLVHALPGRNCPASHSPLCRACPRFDSADRERVQPAAELRHVQRHGHERHVLHGALRPCPAPPSLESRVLYPCMPLALPPPHTFPDIISRNTNPIPYQGGFFGLGTSAFNQPLSLDTSSVTDMNGMFYVRSGRACPGPHSNRSGPPGSHHTSPRIVSPIFDSAGRGGVQPVPELRHVQRHGHAPYVPGALHACPDP